MIVYMYDSANGETNTSPTAACEQQSCSLVFSVHCTLTKKVGMSIGMKLVQTIILFGRNVSLEVTALSAPHHLL